MAKDASKHIPGSIRRPSLRLSDIHNPWAPAVHETPVQKNSTSGEAKWFSDWKWLHPFSSSITLDEDRSVLPPLRIRPPVYTYYDSTVEKAENIRKAENQLLLIWRRAWWAKGFRPVILGPPEAMKNPLYEQVQNTRLTSALQAELMRWLAWGHMGTGILANWLAVPMAPYDDPLLASLRRASETLQVTRYESLSSGLYSGSEKAINEIINTIMKSPELNSATTILEATPVPAKLKVAPKPASIAYYETTALKSDFEEVADALLADQAKGLSSLAKLITAHLHSTWLNHFSDGIAILVPDIIATGAICTPALTIAASLNKCHISPVPQSCPPNEPKCRQCSPQTISFPGSYTNSSELFTIGTVPHPFTMTSLLAKRTDHTVRYIRRETKRDPWLIAVTKNTSAEGISGYDRIVPFKEDVASEWGTARSIWTTAEHDWNWPDLEWNFGFALPDSTDGIVAGDPLDTDLTAPLRHSTSKQINVKEHADILAGTKHFMAQPSLFDQGKGTARTNMRDVIEAWNLADSEAWRFVRAYVARMRFERLKWEEDEKAFVGDAGANGFRRWFDRR